LSGEALMLSELALIFGAVVGWGVWELYTLKKDK
jgi:hypothetical protein